MKNSFTHRRFVIPNYFKFYRWMLAIPYFSFNRKSDSIMPKNIIVSNRLPVQAQKGE